MSRYIDADLMQEKAYQMNFDRRINERELFLFNRALSEMPTVDAVPVVHAYWIIKPHGTYGQLRAFCSACGKHSGIGGIVSNQKKPYCPNCGAIMDGKEIVDG